jgi:hypothetical protein
MNRRLVTEKIDVMQLGQAVQGQFRNPELGTLAIPKNGDNNNRSKQNLEVISSFDIFAARVVYQSRSLCLSEISKVSSVCFKAILGP